MSIAEFIEDFSEMTLSHISQYDFESISKLLFSIEDYYDKYYDEFDDLSYNIKEAFKNENDKNYEDSAKYFIEVYEEVKNKIPYSLKNETKNYFEYKISKMKYNYALSYYKNKDYSYAIDLFKECLENEYMTKNIKIDCQYKLVFSLYNYGKERYDNKCFYDAKDNFEEALKIFNGNYWKLKDKILSHNVNNIKKELGKSYFEIAKIKWNNYDINSMEASLEYFKKANNYNVESSKYYQLYYYLYKAYYESKSNRTSNLDMARKFEDHRSSGMHMYILPFLNDYGIYDVTIYYNKSKRITELEYQIEQKRNKISNLNYELNSINNNISNTKIKINAKNIAITNKNNALTSLNNLADTLVNKGNDINNDIKNIINEEKNQIVQVKQNIQSKKNFVKKISKLEKQKIEDIENMKNNNKKLKQNNEQLFLMLTSLESKFN